MSLLPKPLRGEDRVPVFDPEDRNLRLVALSQLDRTIIPLRELLARNLENVLTYSAAQYTVLDIPRLHPYFDIYGSNELDTEKTYAVVTRDEHAKVELSFIARLNFYRLGWWRAATMRMVGKEYRRLWVGPIPESARLD